MEVFNCIIAVPLGVTALFFLYIGLRRGNRFHFHDYQGDDKERLRDNFISSFTMMTSIFCVFPIVIPIKSWGFTIPFTLLMILVTTVVLMFGAYLNSFIGDIVTGGISHNNRDSWQTRFYLKNGKDIPTLEWYEFTPFAFASGWTVYYLVYVALLLVLGFKINSDNVPMWIIFVGLIVGIITAALLTIGVHRKFKNS